MNQDIIISDTSNNRIRRLTSATGIISTIAGTGASSYTGNNGFATSATMSNPTCVTIDGGMIYSLTYIYLLTYSLIR